MLKTYITWILVLMILSGISCSNSNRKIHNIWIGDYELTLYFDDKESIVNELPELLDFSNSKIGLRKYFTGNEIMINWNYKDSILTIDSINYRIISISGDSLVFSPNIIENKRPEEKSNDDDIVQSAAVRDTYYVYKRIVNKKITQDSISLSKLLTGKIWIKNRPDNDTSEYFDWIEFFNNRISIMKFIRDSTNQIHLQEECWEIENYKGYSFLVFYSNGIQGMFTHEHQILDLNDSEFKIKAWHNKSLEFRFFPSELSQLNSTNFVGEWISINDTSSICKRYLPEKQLKRGFIRLYNDTLTYKFSDDSLTISGIDFQQKCKWYLNSDKSILLFEHPLVNEYIKGVYVQYASILDRDSNSFSIELFDNYINTGLNKPYAIVINKVQEFKRVQ